MSRLIAPFILALASALAHAGPLGPDGTPGISLPGKFIWFDLATENVAAARVFYAAVFGWKFEEVPGGPAEYTMIRNASGKVGGMFRKQRPRDARAGAHWLSLISVLDVEQAARKVRESGGSVILPPTSVLGRGTHAVFRDPQGAIFGVLAAAGGDPVDDPVVDGDVFWLDLFTPDAPKAAAFYADLAGYEAAEGPTRAGPKRWYLVTGAIARAGIIPQQSAGLAPAWLPYFLVDDVPATIEKARRAGGKVLIAPRFEYLNGKVAVLADPNGGVFGIVDWP
jgi:predicted enzyme related to lactoylglutathione lyase